MIEAQETTPRRGRPPNAVRAPEERIATASATLIEHLITLDPAVTQRINVTLNGNHGVTIADCIVMLSALNKVTSDRQ